MEWRFRHRYEEKGGGGAAPTCRGKAFPARTGHMLQRDAGGVIGGDPG